MAGLGQSSAVGIGGDPVKGTEFIDVLEMFLADGDTRSIIMIGEIGGQLKRMLRSFWLMRPKKDARNQPLALLLDGPHRLQTMGHAGAVISGGKGGADEKIDALERLVFAYHHLRTTWRYLVDLLNGDLKPLLPY